MLMAIVLTEKQYNDSTYYNYYIGKLCLWSELKVYETICTKAHESIMEFKKSMFVDTHLRWWEASYSALANDANTYPCWNYFPLKEMIKKRNLDKGLNENLSLDQKSAAQSINNIKNSIIINPKDDRKEDIVIIRDVTLKDDLQNELSNSDIRSLILETYACILLDQDKALISNLVSIIKAIIGGEVEVFIDEHDGVCCAVKVSDSEDRSDNDRYRQ